MRTRWRVVFPFAAAVFALALGVSPTTATVVLNELLYDPAGADAGKEFVELFNPDPLAVCLAGYRIEFANGADASPTWATRWTGSAADTIRGRGWFLVADVGWTGPPAAAAVAPLALQNGPDAVRLRRPDGGEDRLGYGALGAPAWYEGAPHPGVAAGQSLARRPDGGDTDDNATDWVPLVAPTPGGPNFALRAASIEALAAEPPVVAAAGWPVAISVQLRNSGLEALPAMPARLIAGAPVGGAEAAPEETTATWLEATAPGEGRVLSFAWTPREEGRRPLRLELPLEPVGLGGTLRAGTYQVGLAGPYWSEVMAAPPVGAGEWVEIGHAGGESLPLGTLQWHDEDGVWHALPSRLLAPGEFLVLSPDCAALIAWWRATAEGGDGTCSTTALAERCLEPSGSWPSLNNAPPSDRTFADRVWLADSTGTVLDCVVLGGNGTPVPESRSLERAHPRPLGQPARNWGPSSAAAGATPGCPNALSVAAPIAAQPALLPNPFSPATGGVLHVQFALAGVERAWDARVFDLWGRRVRDLGGDILGSGPRDVVWDGRDDRGTTVVTGGYVVLVRRFDARGGLLGSARRLAVVSAAKERP